MELMIGENVPYYNLSTKPKTSLQIRFPHCFFEKKPAIDVCFVKDGLITIF